MTRPTILELRHAECESPGTYGAGLAGLADVRTVRTWREELPTDPRDFAGILVMGGPMGANDGATMPWIDTEIAFLTAAVAADVPIWGVCLGSQLLARALGARVFTGPAGEVGVAEVTLTDDARTDPVFSAITESTFPAMHWHYDTFTLPDGATRLAGSQRYENQLYRHGPHYGVQFHLEVDTDLLRARLDVEDYRGELVAALGPGAPASVAADVAAAQTITAPLAATLIRRWFDSFVIG